jgi:hypothetical protein
MLCSPLMGVSIYCFRSVQTPTAISYRLAFICFLFIFNSLRDALPSAQTVSKSDRSCSTKRKEIKPQPILILECSSIVNLTTHDCKIARSSSRSRDAVHLLINFRSFQWWVVSYAPSTVCLPVISTSVIKPGMFKNVHLSVPLWLQILEQGVRL